MSYKIGFDPTLDKWVLSDGEHYLEVPHWAREIIADEFERETRQLRDENAKLRDGAYAMRQLYEDELKHALAENAKLREQGARLFDKTLELGTENAKLRELVRWMYDRMDESCAVQHPYAPAPISYDRLMQALARARELGVEVEQ